MKPAHFKSELAELCYEIFRSFRVFEWNFYVWRAIAKKFAPEHPPESSIVIDTPTSRSKPKKEIVLRASNKEKGNRRLLLFFRLLFAFALYRVLGELLRHLLETLIHQPIHGTFLEGAISTPHASLPTRQNLNALINGPH